MKHLRVSALLCIGAALAPAAASAQVYINTTRTEAYVDLASIPGITGITPVSFGNNDDLDVTITLPFTFVYLGQNMTQIRAGANGYITLGNPGAIDAPTSFSNVALGGTGIPNNYIAPLWDDMLHPSAANARWGVVGTAPNRIFVFEAGPATRYSASGGTLFWQLWLFEGASGRFEYRATGNPVNTLSATIGYEGPAGTPFHNPLGCSPTCALGGGWDGVVFVTFAANEPELTGGIVSFPRGALPGESVQVEVALRNLGVDTATTVASALYLSADATLDAGDALVGTLGPTDIPGGNLPVAVTATVTVPGGQAPGDYYLLLEVDSDDLWPETSESDNVVASATRFATAHDVRASAIALSGAQGGNPGDPLTFDVTIAGDGVPYVGPLDLDLRLSLDQIVDSNDPTIGAATVNVTGAATEVVSVTVTLPASLAPGRYYAVVTVDPLARIDELNENNNTYVAGASFQVGYDFALTTITAPAQIAPGASGTVTTRVGSLAAPYSGTVAYRLYASADATYDPQDPLLGTYTVSFAGEASIDSVQTVTPPTLPSGQYFIVGVVDPLNAIRELSETNNTTASTIAFANAADFAAGAVTFTPAIVEAGDTLNVTSSILALGLSYSGSVPYSIYFSPDDVFDLADERVYDGTLLLSGQASTPLSLGMPIPTNLPVRTFYAIVVVDPDGTVPESIETNNWTSSSATLRIRGADLQVEELAGAGTAFIGLPYRVSLTIRNDGEADARSFRYAYYLSTNDIIRVTDTQLLLSGTATVASGQTASFTDMLTLPTFTSTQTLWLGVILDVTSQVPEDSEGNNIGRIPAPISIVFPIPDLSAQIVETATAGAAGEQLAVTRVLLNSGVADAPAFTYAYYLSSNPNITTDDVFVGEVSTSLGESEDDFGFDVLRIPSDVPPGTYYLGIIVDPAGAVTEVSEDNNSFAGPQLPIYAAAIQFLTQSLPDATLGSQYQVGVYASGGPVGITWAVQSGALPMGVTLDSAAGILAGVPVEEGTFEFVLRALSGTAYADAPFSIRVLAPTVPLRVATTTLDTALVGRDYTTTLVAVGGAVPYEWSAISTLPQGMTLSADGVLSGAPEASGNTRLTVRVRDSIGGSASKELALNIINPGQKLVITQLVLPTAIVGFDYCAQDQITFEAMGGVPPYAWAAVGATPAGMTFSADGVLCGAPEQAGVFPLLVRVQDQAGGVDTSLFLVEVDDGRELAIATFSLDAGDLDVAYDAALTAVRGDEPYTWSIIEGSGALPPGLALNATTGHIAGTPTQAGVFAFTVQVVDGKLRTDLQPLSIQINAPEEVDMTNDDSCSCTSAEDARGGSAGAAGLLGLLGALLFARGRAPRRGKALGILAGLVLGAATIALPGSARAQFVPGTPYVMTYTPITYSNLSSPTVIFTSGDDSYVDVPLPFPFKFYETEYTTITVGTNAGITMGPGGAIGLTNPTPGSSGTPNAWIAPFWDDQQVHSGTDHLVGYQVDGVAPNRTITIEWRNLGRYANSGVTMNFSVRLFEGASARIQLDYGTVAGSGSFSSTMAMEDSAGARPIIFAPSGCTTTCSQTDLQGLTNTRIDVVQDPGIELVAGSITAPQFGFLGAQLAVQASLANLHGQVIGPFSVQVVASTSPDLTNPVDLGSTELTLAAFQSATVTLDAVPPASLGEGLFYLGLIVDPANGVAEANENNNVAVSAGQIRILEGKADLAVTRVATTVGSAAAGDVVPVVVEVSNVGGLPAMNATVGVMLSSNPVASPQDVQLATFTVSLDPGETTSQTVDVTLPPATNSGSYYLGALADPSDAIEELSESNNGRTTFDPIAVSGGALQVTTTQLPVGYVRVTYTGLLSSAGGDSTRTWSITAGQLPSGLGLVPSTGEIFGRPLQVESETFTVQVESGGQTATKQLTLMVVSPEEPLTIVSRAVPPGTVGQEYAFELVATGGTVGSTITWSATGLPDGLALSDSGVLGGTPSAAATTTFTVTAASDGETATRELSLTVRENTNLAIVAEELPHAAYGAMYSHQLQATGGLTPYTWLIEVGQLPDGMTLATTGELSGTPTQVGTYRIIVEVRDGGAPGRQAKDTNSFVLVVDDVSGFSITVSSLPDATVEAGYDQTIATTGGAAPIEWSILEGTLPDGLVGSPNTTTNEFRIAGQPNTAGTSNLLLQARDSQGRIATRAFALRVLPKVEMLVVDTSNDGGCGCVAEPGRGSSGAAGIGLLGLLGLFVFVGRRRSPVGPRLR